MQPFSVDMSTYEEAATNMDSDACQHKIKVVLTSYKKNNDHTFIECMHMWFGLGVRQIKLDV